MGLLPTAFALFRQEVQWKGVTAMDSAMEYIAQTGEMILNLARQFTLKDAVDVAIVTVLLYSAIKLVRETRAGQ